MSAQVESSTYPGSDISTHSHPSSLFKEEKTRTRERKERRKRREKRRREGDQAKIKHHHLKEKMKIITPIFILWCAQQISLFLLKCHSQTLTLDFILCEVKTKVLPTQSSQGKLYSPLTESSHGFLEIAL
jgi:hypothetical protein